MIRRHTSADVHSLNVVNDDVVVCCTGGGDRLAVDLRTSSIFGAKNAANWSAECPVVLETSRSRPRTDDNERQSRCVERPHCCNRPSQYSSFLVWYTWKRRRVASTHWQRSASDFVRRYRRSRRRQYFVRRYRRSRRRQFRRYVGIQNQTTEPNA